MAQRRISNFVFPRWANYLLPVLVLGALGTPVYAVLVVFFGLSATTLNEGYMPEQPVPYSHALHVGELGIDCRYCHNTVDHAAFAAVPPTQTCINCHAPGRLPEDPALIPAEAGEDAEPGGSTGLAGVWQNSPGLQPVWESYYTGESVEWVKVHDIADYAYFNHAAHVNRGVGCYSCHGRVDRMAEEGVYQVHNLSMGWCLECHREPQRHLRPASEVTNMQWHLGSEAVGERGMPQLDGESVDEAQLRIGNQLLEDYHIRGEAYMQACSTCHR